MTSLLTRSARALRRAPMLQGRSNVIATALLGVGVTFCLFRFLGWSLLHAIFTLPSGAGSSLCRANQGEGACWAVIHERFRFIVLGSTYPSSEQWRPLLACLLFIGLYIASAIRAWWKPWLLSLWVVVPAAAITLMLGGILGLTLVPSDRWGGLPLTFMLSTVGFALAFPLSVALALGRRSEMPVIRTLSIAYIELIRGVPLVTFLFMATVMFPLFLPQSFAIDKLVRAQVAFVLVIAAYLAEVVRAGLEAIPKGQHEAAASMGLSFWPATILIVLPQALRATIPALVNTFIAFFKDTSLVAVIGLFDLLGAAKTVIVDPKWIGFGIEVYVFAGAVYFAFCYAVSRYTQHLEKTLAARTHP
jgi:general L-amino acid transport system permease protein